MGISCILCDVTVAQAAEVLGIAYILVELPYLDLFTDLLLSRVPVNILS